MKKIEWKDEYNLGIPAIDRQHQKLFIYIDELRIAVFNDDRKHGTAKALENLLNYGLEHFEFEESLIQKAELSFLDDHRKQHDSYNGTIFSWKTKIERGDDIMATDLIVFVKKWLLEHILVEDKKYADIFKTNKFHCSEME